MAQCLSEELRTERRAADANEQKAPKSAPGTCHEALDLLARRGDGGVDAGGLRRLCQARAAQPIMAYHSAFGIIDPFAAFDSDHLRNRGLDLRGVLLVE